MQLECMVGGSQIHNQTGDCIWLGVGEGGHKDESFLVEWLLYSHDVFVAGFVKGCVHVSVCVVRIFIVCVWFSGPQNDASVSKP